MIFSKIRFKQAKTNFTSIILLFTTLSAISCGTREIQSEIIETNLGEKFSIELASKKSSGYSWVWANKGENSKVDTSSVLYEVTKTSSAIEMGIEFWSFDALEKGEELIIMEYTDSKSDKEPNQIIHYKVNIK